MSRSIQSMLACLRLLVRLEVWVQARFQARVLRVATFGTRVQRYVVCCTENSFPRHAPPRTLPRSQNFQTPYCATPSRGDWAPLPTPSRRRECSLELDYSSQATHFCGASPPRTGVARIVMVEAVEWSSKHVVALPILRNALVFVASRHYAHIRIVIRMHLLNKNY